MRTHRVKGDEAGSQKAAFSCREFGFELSLREGICLRQPLYISVTQHGEMLDVNREKHSSLMSGSLAITPMEVLGLLWKALSCGEIMWVDVVLSIS